MSRARVGHGGWRLPSGIGALSDHLYRRQTAGGAAVTTAGSYSAKARMMGSQSSRAALTIGIFDPANVAKLLALPAQQAVVTGQQPMEFVSAATGQPGEIHGETSVKVSLDHPLMPAEQAIAVHQHTLDAMDRADAQAGAPQRSTNSKLLHLQEQLGREIVPTGTQELGVETHPYRDGDLHHFRHVPTVPGHHVANVEVTAHDDQGYPFTLVKRVTFWAY